MERPSLTGRWPAVTATAFIIAVFVSLWMTNGDFFEDAPSATAADAPAPRS